MLPDAELLVAERPIAADLRAIGIDVDSPWDLRMDNPDHFPAALPVLIKHLERGGSPDGVMEGLARSMAVKSANVYWDRLRDLYLRATGEDQNQGLAAALAASARVENLDDLIALLDEPSKGRLGVHFIRPILRLCRLRGYELVESLRDDPRYGLEATALLKRRKRPSR